MLQSTNPFADPEFKKQIMADEGILEPTEIPEAEVLAGEVEMEKEDDSIDFKSLVACAPQMPASAKTIIADASLLAKNERDQKVAQMTASLNNVFSEYNKTYGTDLSIDFNNLSKTLVNVADPDTRRTLELFTSEVLKSLKPILILHMISRLSVALEYVLSPERMFDSNQLSLPDMFLVIEKLQQYILNLSDIIDTSSIKDSDKILDKLAEEKSDNSLNSQESKAAVDEFMKLFNKENSKIN